MDSFSFSSQILHSDRLGKPEHGSIHKPVHHAVAFGYDNTQDLIEVFQGKQKGFAYGRQSNPTVEVLQSKITQMEQGRDALLFSTGMGAISSLCFALLKQGDHIIVSQFLFGNTHSFFKTLNRIGISVSFVNTTCVSHVQHHFKSNTKLVFTETIANPVTQISDLHNIGNICQKHNCLFVVDNTMTSPFLFQPKKVKAGLIVHSLTKYLGGHASALGGAIVDTGMFNWEYFKDNIFEAYRSKPINQWGLIQIRKKGLRDCGASMSPESAFILSLGMDTLSLRQTKSCDNALILATFLSQHPLIEKVYYPGLSNHPQHHKAQSWFPFFGGVFSFEFKSNQLMIPFLNKLKLFIKSSHLGDNRSLIIPVAQTIYFEMGKKQRQAMSISESLVRVSVGIEDSKDLLADLNQALSSL